MGIRGSRCVSDGRRRGYHPGVTHVVANTLDRTAATIERRTALDSTADALARLFDKAIPPGPVRNFASGAFLGHPVHPALVAVPIGSWASASLLDLTGGDRKAAERLVLFGIASALPTAVAGAHDYITTAGAARRVGLVHALVNDVAIAAYFASWRARRRGKHLRGVALALAGSVFLSAGGWLGGHLTYTRGVRVDRSRQTEPSRDA
jgi:uncharacterized membrane protein